MVRVLYPGSFNPISKGHRQIINQASELFDEVVVAVMCNPNKPTGMFTIDERVAMIKELYKDVDNVKVVSSTGATVDVAKENGCHDTGVFFDFIKDCVILGNVPVFTVIHAAVFADVVMVLICCAVVISQSVNGSF